MTLDLAVVAVAYLVAIRKRLRLQLKRHKIGSGVLDHVSLKQQYGKASEQQVVGRRRPTLPALMTTIFPEAPAVVVLLEQRRKRATAEMTELPSARTNCTGETWERWQSGCPWSRLVRGADHHAKKRKSMRCYLYILRSTRADRLYIGSSAEPDERLKSHNFGEFFRRRPGDPGSVFCLKNTKTALPLRKESAT